MRQDLQIDAGLIHLADAQRAEIIEPLDDIATRAGTSAELLDLVVLVVLFERDDVWLLCHSCSPSLCLVPASLDGSTAASASCSVSAIVIFASSIGRREAWT